MPFFRATGRDLAAFLASCTYIAAMLTGAALMMYPVLLPATNKPSYSLTIYNAKTGSYSLTIGLVWWLIGIILAIGYFSYLYRSFRGKVALN